jgi:transcriptional regulator with XRE-family HTH domain
MKQKDKEFELFLKKLSKNIRKKREDLNITQEKMDSGKYAIDYKYYQRIESGNRNITLNTLFKICKKLNINPRDLFDFEI